MILTVCTGNICRSPLAAEALRVHCPGLDIQSAGLHAVVGHDVDEDTRAVALKLGLILPKHSARQFDEDMAKEARGILVMEKHHRHEISKRWPFATGKTFLLGQFDNLAEVPDPYRMGFSAHYSAAEMILRNAVEWAPKLGVFQ